jgi:hypothetical protein
MPVGQMSVYQNGQEPNLKGRDSHYELKRMLPDIISELPKFGKFTRGRTIIGQSFPDLST